jgi:hypothetical protein
MLSEATKANIRSYIPRAIANMGRDDPAAWDARACLKSMRRLAKMFGGMESAGPNGLAMQECVDNPIEAKALIQSIMDEIKHEAT